MTRDIWQQVVQAAVAIDQATVNPRSRVQGDGKPEPLPSTLLRALGQLEAHCAADGTPRAPWPWGT